MGEHIEDFGSYSDFGPLIGKVSIFQMVAKATFHSIHGDFRKAPAMVPVAEHLTKNIPGYRFVVVPLASREDIERSLKKGNVDFLALDPVMEIIANDLYGATPLVTMVETGPDTAPPQPSNAISSGTLIRLADRSDLAGIQDLRGKRLSAVKPWSLTGWIAQWGLLQSRDIDPQKDLKQVVFEGTNEQVIKSVLNGSADVAAVDADMLLHLIRAGQVLEKSLYYSESPPAKPEASYGNRSKR